MSYVVERAIEMRAASVSRYSVLCFFKSGCLPSSSPFFFFKDPPPTEIYPLPLPAAFPILISHAVAVTIFMIAMFPVARKDDDAQLGPGVAIALLRDDLINVRGKIALRPNAGVMELARRDRKSTRLNSSHLVISYAVFCLKK